MKLPDKFQIRIFNPDHSAVVQNQLFELGYTWSAPGKIPRNTETKYLQVGAQTRSLITHSGCTEDKWGPFITLDDLMMVQPPQQKVIKIPSFQSIVLNSDGSVEMCGTLIDKESFDSIIKKRKEFLQ